MNSKLLGVAGILVILGIASLCRPTARLSDCVSSARRSRCRRSIAWLVLYTSWGRAGIQALSGGVGDLLGYANKGTEFLFGPSECNPLAHTLRDRSACRSSSSSRASSRSFIIWGSCSGSCAGLAARSAGSRVSAGSNPCQPLPTFSSASRNRRSSCGRTSRRCRLRGCSRSCASGWRASPARSLRLTRACSGRSTCLTCSQPRSCPRRAAS